MTLNPNDTYYMIIILVRTVMLIKVESKQEDGGLRTCLLCWPTFLSRC